MPQPPGPLVVDLVDGTCELFRHFHGLPRFPQEDRAERAQKAQALACARGQPPPPATIPR